MKKKLSMTGALMAVLVTVALCFPEQVAAHSPAFLNRIYCQKIGCTMTGALAVPSLTVGGVAVTGGSSTATTDLREGWVNVSDGTTYLLAASPTTTTDGTGSAYVDAGGKFINYATGAVVNAVAGWRWSATVARPDHLPDYTFIWKEPAAAEANFIDWVGLFAVFPTTSATTGIANIAAFRYATSADGTTWRAVTSTSGATAETTDTGITANVGANTMWIMRVRWTTSTTVEFYLNGALVATHSTSVPDTTTATYATMRRITTEAVAKNFRAKKMYFTAK